MRLVVEIRHPTCRELATGVAHGAHICALKRLPVAHGPLVRTAPGIDNALRVGLLHQDAVVAAHGRERTDAACEAEREDGDLADLALLVGHVLRRAAVNPCGFTLVNIFARTKHVEHLVGLRIACKPGRRARFYR